MVSKAVEFRLGNGSIPTIGLGTWTVFGEQGNSSDIEEATKVAIDAGYRHIDCAWCYGTQDGVGHALEAKIKEGVIKREDMFITTKLWDTHHNPKLVMGELQDSLRQLKTTYVDLFLIHWSAALQDQDYSGTHIVPRDEHGEAIWASYPLEDVWKAMEECQIAGLTKNIGVSNFNSKQVNRMFACCRIQPVNIQIEISPYFSNASLRDFCLEKGMTVTAYAPLGASTRPWRASDDPNPFEEPVLIDIAAEKGKTVAQIILRYHLQCGLIVIPKSITPSRIQENIQVYDFSLSKDEMDKIQQLNRNLRVYQEPILIGHPEYSFDEPF